MSESMKSIFKFINSIPGSAPNSRYALEGQPREATRPLAMMHIPKTAGTSVMHDISRFIKPKQDIRGFDRTLFGGFSNFASMDEHVSKIIYRETSDLPADAMLIMGHFSYHTLKNRYPAAQLMTFLREPLVRLLSHWIFWRSHLDEDIASLGGWADSVKLSRQSLKAFLLNPEIACQTDNIATRMLLWPDGDISPNQFIGDESDRAVLEFAFERLNSFAYSDVIENPIFGTRLNSWLQSDVGQSRLNETNKVPADLRLRLERELDAETLELLQQRSRLDLRLWSALAQHRMPDQDIKALRFQTVLGGVARYSRLLDPA